MAGMERFPGYGKEDTEFLGNVFDKAKLSARIDRLAKGDLGKAMNVAFDDDPDGVTVGYVLPLKTDNTKHLALFKDGSIFIIKPEDQFPIYDPDEEGQGAGEANADASDNSEEDELDLASGYRTMFSPSDHPYTFGFSTSEYTMDQAVSLVIGNVRGNSKVILENKTYQSIPKLKEAFGQVMSVAREAKKERETAGRDSVRNLVDMLDEEIGDSDKPFHHPDEDPPFDSPPNK
jgi:hypothetical protein